MEYIVNTEGKQVAVILPIDMWDKISKKQDLPKKNVKSNLQNLTMDSSLENKDYEKIMSFAGSWSEFKECEDFVTDTYNQRNDFFNNREM
jgi:hypothetical protein